MPTAAVKIMNGGVNGRNVTSQKSDDALFERTMRRMKVEDSDKITFSQP